MPISVPPGVAITVPSRAGARPSGRMPTRRRAGPSLISRMMRAWPGKAPFLTATLLDRPVQRRLDRGGLRVDIMAIKAIAGLEPQRIARPQPDRLHRLMRGELVPQGERIIVGHRNLVAVLAGIA